MSNSSQYSISTLHYALTFAGAVPFIVAATLTLLGVSALPWVGPVVSAVMVYGVIIASFMAGSLWGLQLALPRPTRLMLAFGSNVFAVGLWLAYLSGNIPLMLIGLIVVFIALVLIDVCLNVADIISRQYLYLRAVVTAIVVCCLGTVGVLL